MSACCCIARARRRCRNRRRCKQRRRRRWRRCCQRPKLDRKRAVRQSGRQAGKSEDIEVRVTPRAGRTGFGGLRDDVLIVKLAAAPVDGAANSELIALLSTTLDIPKRDITIVSGERSRSKRVRIAGMDRERVVSRIRNSLGKVTPR